MQYGIHWTPYTHLLTLTLMLTLKLIHLLFLSKRPPSARRITINEPSHPTANTIAACLPACLPDLSILPLSHAHNNIHDTLRPLDNRFKNTIRRRL